MVAVVVVLDGPAEVSSQSHLPESVTGSPPASQHPRALLPFTSGRREAGPARVDTSGASNDISVVWSPGKVVQSSGTAAKQEHKDNSQSLGSPGKIIQGAFGAQNIGEKNNEMGARKFEQVISETSVRVSGQANSIHHRQTNDLSKSSTSGDKVKGSVATGSGQMNIGASKQQSGAGVRSSEQANKRASIRSTEQTSNRANAHSSEQARKRASVRSSEQSSNKASIRSTETQESRGSRRTSQNQLHRQTSKNSDRS
ncbi:hypothetical protein C0Q70_01250 [Pomacea canaliculata]|uniref:Uncharacterized protein n=1 Tax=Pomacea canaliculata TaxID=400727 RepID=A0A2T7PYY8_POMCA|nr:hypothetical protein C0Q70_01250 [Pomacea canaliculata]